MSLEASPCCRAWSCEWWVFSPGRLVIWGVVFGASSSLGGAHIWKATLLEGLVSGWKVLSLDGRSRLWMEGLVFGWKVSSLESVVVGRSRLRNVSSSECLVYGTALHQISLSLGGGCSSRQLTHLIKSILNDYSNHLPLSKFVSLVTSVCWLWTLVAVNGPNRDMRYIPC